MFQGLGCSPIKAVRELGSERRETVRSISGVGVRALRGPFPSTRLSSGKSNGLLFARAPCHQTRTNVLAFPVAT